MSTADIHKLKQLITYTSITRKQYSNKNTKKLTDTCVGYTPDVNTNEPIDALKMSSYSSTTCISDLTMPISQFLSQYTTLSTCTTHSMQYTVGIKVQQKIISQDCYYLYSDTFPIQIAHEKRNTNKTNQEPAAGIHTDTTSNTQTYVSDGKLLMTENVSSLAGLPMTKDKHKNNKWKTLPYYSLPQYDKCYDKFGIIKPGTWVKQGDTLVGKRQPQVDSRDTPEEQLLYDIFTSRSKNMKDTDNHQRIHESVPYTNYAVWSSMHSRNAETRMHDHALRSMNYHGYYGWRSINSVQEHTMSYILNPFTGMHEYSNIENVETHGRSHTQIHANTSQTGYKPYTVQGTNNNNAYYASRSTAYKDTSFVLSHDIQARVLQTYYFPEGYQNYTLPQKRSYHNVTINTFGKPIPDTVKSEYCTDKVKNPDFRNTGTVIIYLIIRRPIQIGDKLAGRHGNKGIVSNIVPQQDMPYISDGTPLDIVLNPLGVPSRMNVGQIYECLLGIAGEYLHENYRVKPFDESYGNEVSRAFVYTKLLKASYNTNLPWLFYGSHPGKTKVFDGRSGEVFEHPITVGVSYIMKLIHLVDEKMHARSTGPYSLITQQPLKGRSKHGGQRLGEMEVWAFEGFGASYLLQEMMTIKSDDIYGRNLAFRDILRKNPVKKGSIPESFRVLAYELRALCFDIIYTAND